MNINEIAALAGVSRATVSRYLNNGYVSAEKREQIRKVIEETGYQPSAQAQMYEQRKQDLLALSFQRSIRILLAGWYRESVPYWAIKDTRSC